ncbi:FliH/SctL family protein [Pelagibius marinus]|uniref:FliH/SctL family protein n=1 Tax=Pelagibius marinus TaxID=2762760 RepID=UPI001872E6BF|nr:FliH/SctL family protein [Pelagibius marinus]
MGTFEKYLFDTSFETEREREAKARAAAEAEATAAPPAPTFSEEELEAARQAAFAEGKAAGLAEAEQSHAKRLADSVADLPPHFDRLAQELEQLETERRRGSLDAAVTVVRKIFPRLARDGGLEEIRAVVEACLERLRDEPRLLIRCADCDLDPLRERIESSTSRGSFEGKLVFLVDETIAAGDVRVEWADGGAERDQSGLWKEIDTIIARAMAPAPPRPTAQPQDQAGDQAGDQAEGQPQAQQDETVAPKSAESPSQPQAAAEIEPLRRAQSA